jgi:hypothetical protein
MAIPIFKKSLILLLFSLVFSLTSFSQKKEKLKEFSNEFPAYLSELDGFMTATDNNKLKLIYKKFLKNTESLSVKEKVNIIQISNKMLLKRLRPNPHFSKFLSAIISVNNSDKGEILLEEWLKVVEETVDAATTNKLMLFCVFTSDLVSKNILRASKSAQWRVSNTNFHFEFEMIEPVIIFDTPFDLSCTSDDGSYTIFGTKGKYYFVSTEWFGQNGLMHWESYGYSKDSVFAEIKSYKIDTRKSEVIADSSIFYNKYDFIGPIFGRVVNKITKGKQAERYPKFTSYSKNVELKEIFKNIDYRGGYKLQGKEFVADGGDYAEAKIVFKRNGKEVFIANANRFSIGSDRIVSQAAGVKIFFDNDSIYHANINFKYIDSKRQLQLYRDANGLSSATMLNTYHNLTMDFELLEWNIDEDLITFGSLPGTAVSKVSFESIARFDSALCIMLGGIDAVHPLFLLNNYVKEKQQEEINVADFARFAQFPIHQIQSLLIRLSRYGFIFYDFGLERITVLPKLYNYVAAASGLGDYDVISFNSIIEPGEYKTGDKYLRNAALNLETKDLNIIGIHNIEVSKNRGVYLKPKDGLVVVKKNRDFIFNGQIFAGNGRLNLFGREFSFDYDNFKVNLNYIDSVQLSVPVQPIQKDVYGNELLTPIKTVIEAVKGELRIDDPTNKSGIRKDSFPEFPIFKSFEDSYAYYDRQSIYSGVYNRDRFSFHLQPFEIDSLDNYTGKGLWFAGTFESSGIFPTFDDTLRLKEDYSLGFTRKTPDDGFLIYGGKGKYYNDIHLSHKGLKGSGTFEYLTSKSIANEIFFFPDSTNLYTQVFEITEVATGIEFPEVKNTETYAHFEPYNDRLNVYKIKDEFDFYQSQATFNGNLLMRPTGLTGGGIMSLDKAKVNASLFTYNADWFGSDAASLRVFEDGGDLAFKANDLKTHIDLAIREGIFHSNGSTSYVELPANQYISYIDKLRWAMDEESLTLGDEVASGEGSKFMSVHSAQDSLSFFAKTAFYSLKDYIIHADGVENIAVADAIIYPDSGVVTVAKKAIIETLYGAKILADNLTEYHTFTNATIDIKSAHNYTANGDYTYKDAMNNKQQIFFKEIRVGEDTITIARGDVATDKVFHIDSKFDFKGSVDLIADQKNLTFDGYFMANHDCALLDKEWIKFRSKVDPKNIKFILDEKIYNETDDLLSTALVMSFDSTDFYSTFLSKKKRTALDVSVLPASYTLQYDNNKFAYIVGGPDTLSNYYTLYDKTCKNSGEGIIDLNLNLGQVKIQSIGNATHNMHSHKTELEGFLMFDFLFSEDAMMYMAAALHDSKDEEVFEYDEKFSKNLGRVVGKERAEILLLDLELRDEYPKFPDKMQHSIVFAKTKLKWDNDNKAYVSKGPIAVHSIMGEHLNSTHTGYLIIEKGANTDILTIYLDTDYDYKYYFQYKNGVMKAWSDNPDFEVAINDISHERRKAERRKGAPAYRYMFVPEEVAEKSLRQLMKKY